jgi:hypothetical protein
MQNKQHHQQTRMFTCIFSHFPHVYVLDQIFFTTTTGALTGSATFGLEKWVAETTLNHRLTTIAMLVVHVTQPMSPYFFFLYFLIGRRKRFLLSPGGLFAQCNTSLQCT